MKKRKLPKRLKALGLDLKTYDLAKHEQKAGKRILMSKSMQKRIDIQKSGK